MDTQLTPEIQAILDYMWYTAYQELWDKPIGQTATITATHRIGTCDLVFRMYAVVRPFANYNARTDRHDNVQLDYRAKLGKWYNIIRAGYVVGTS